MSKLRILLGNLAGLQSITAAGATAGRDPTILDDELRGNTTGRLWLNSSTGQFWTCTDNLIGAAVWASAGTPTALPGDAVASVTACYGTKPLKTAWANGNLFKVQRRSDNAQQIIAASGGVTDVTALNTFLSGTVGRVIIWYDQSGNGNDCSQATFANAPFIRVIGTEVFVCWDYYSSGNVDDCWLTLPSVTWGSSLSVFSQVAMNSVTHGEFTIFELGTDTSNFQGWYNQHYNAWADQSGAFLTSSAAYGADCNPTILSMVSTSSTATAYWGERAVTNYLFKTKGTPVGGRIGRSAQKSGGPYFYDGAMQSFMVWSSALSDANALLVRKSMYQWASIVPQQSNDLIVYAGDSEMSPYTQWWPDIDHINNHGASGYGAAYQSRPLYTRPCREVNTAINGWTLAQMNSHYTTDIAPLYDIHAAHNILVFDGGINDGHADGKTPAEALALLQTFCTNATATGWRCYFITMFSFGSSFDPSSGYGSGTADDGDNWRLDYDTRVRNAFSGGNLAVVGLIDIGATSTAVGAVGAYTNTTYFDNYQHWNAAGAALAAVDPYIPTRVNYELAQNFDLTRWPVLQLWGDSSGEDIDLWGDQYGNLLHTLRLWGDQA